MASHTRIIFPQSMSRVDMSRALLNHDNSPCEGRTHTLICCHSVTLNTRACSASCRRPQFGNKARHPYDCPICASKTEEEKLLEEVAAIHDMRDQLEALRSDFTNPLSSRDIEHIDDQIFQSELSLQLTVSQSLWSLYAHSGEEGVRNQQAAQELEETEKLERRYVQLMRREWYVQKAALEEEHRREINELAAKGYVSEIQAVITEAQEIIAEGPQGEDLISREQSRLSIEFAHESLQHLHAALTVAEAVDPVKAKRQMVAERRVKVERLEAQL